MDRRKEGGEEMMMGMGKKEAGKEDFMLGIVVVYHLHYARHHYMVRLKIL